MRVYTGRLWSARTFIHFPVTASQTRTVQSNDDVATISFVPGPITGSHPIEFTEWVWPVRTTVCSEVARPGMISSESLSILSTLHMRVVVSSEQDANRVRDGLYFN